VEAMSSKSGVTPITDEPSQADLDRFVETLKTLGSPDHVVEMVIHTNKGMIRVSTKGDPSSSNIARKPRRLRSS
jgi:hypothetical protein